MCKLFEVYEINVDSLEFGRRLLEQVLDFKFTPHSSDCVGDYYHWGKQYGEELVLQENFDASESEYRDARFKNAKFLLCVNLPGNPDQLKSAIAAVPHQVVLLDARSLA